MQAGGVRGAGSRGRGDRLRRRHVRARWCARRTAPDASTSRRWSAGPATAALAGLRQSAVAPDAAPALPQPPRRTHMAKSGKPGRIKQMIQAYQVTKQGDPKIGLILLGTFVFSAAVGTALFMPDPAGVAACSTSSPASWSACWARSSSSVAARRSRSSSRSRGSPAPPWPSSGMLRRGWKTDQMVAFNKQQDIVHRVVGPARDRPGRRGQRGPAPRAAQLRAQAAPAGRRGDPGPQIVVGYGEGEVPARPSWPGTSPR